MRRALQVGLLAGVFFVISYATFAGVSPFGAVGLALTKQDYQAIEAAAKPLLNDDSLAIGTTRDWSSPKSGNHGSIKLLKRFEETVQGATLPCRKLEHTVEIKGQADPYNLVIDRCKVADGSWKIL
jgi:surface antigen